MMLKKPSNIINEGVNKERQGNRVYLKFDLEKYLNNFLIK